MTSGQVDENWAREHHPLWLQRLKDKLPRGAKQQPAE